MQKSKNKEIYMRFLLSALPILVIPVMLLFGAYFRNQTLYKQEIYNKKSVHPGKQRKNGGKYAGFCGKHY